MTRDSLRAAIGLVMEDSFLFSDTVRANIAYGRPDATDEQVGSRWHIGYARRYPGAHRLRSARGRRGAQPVRSARGRRGAQPVRSARGRRGAQPVRSG
ncbi:MAG: hypothetical protein ACRDOE_00980 [Streptosporangiaceae bacterium]